MSIIDGHNRDALSWLLSEHERLGVQGYAILRAHAQAKPQLLRYPEMAPFVDDITDPAKLAAMIAERGRELGFDIWIDTSQSRWFADPSDPWQLAIFWTDVQVEVYPPNENDAIVLALPQARAILQQWLQLPDGATNEAEKVLRGKHE